MKILLTLLFIFTACATKPVTDEHWEWCEFLCQPWGVQEACVHSLKGEGCTCYNGGILWRNQ